MRMIHLARSVLASSQRIKRIFLLLLRVAEQMPLWPELRGELTVNGPSTIPERDWSSVSTLEPGSLSLGMGPLSARNNTLFARNGALSIESEQTSQQAY